jgi:hypothetical protein
VAALTEAWARSLAGPCSIVAASRDDRLVPSCTRVAALRCNPGSDRVTIWVATGSSARFLADVRATATVAIVNLEPISHRTLQLKGRAIAVRPAPEQDRVEVEAQLRRYFEHLELVGLPVRLTDRFVRWPATAIDVAVEEVFDQTPGPGAGERAEAG